MDFALRHLAAILRRLPSARRYWVAYSGGLDSHVLLHAVAQLRPALGAVLHAVHVDHGLSPLSARWSSHCEQVCTELDVPYRGLRVAAAPRRGESPEAAARASRYEALGTILEPGDALLTAHHQDDQGETLLLQLLRGAGPHGLAAMPMHQPFHGGWHGRPLLDFARAELRAYAQAQDLRWIEDHSNLDPRFARNYLRHRIMPPLAARWPAVGATLGRAARHQAEAARLLDVLGEMDLKGVVGERPDTLHRAALCGLEPERARNVLRYWLRGLGLPVPGAGIVERILGEVVTARWDAEPLVEWPGGEIRRYRDLLYAGAPRPRPAERAEWPWSLTSPLELPAGRLTARRVCGAGIKAALCTGGRVTVRQRRGGERCRPVGRGMRRTLKHLFQERGTPPWERVTVPLVYVNGELAQVVGVTLCEPFAAGSDEEGWVIALERNVPGAAR